MPTAAPARIGPYEIHREIGRGGMGVVFAARDTRLDRDVAIKALPELLARNPERLARFQREARLLASLNHPHIASIYGLEEIDGRSYLVLEYVDGETLEALLRRRGALPVTDALNLALQIARAVEAAHQRGVIHRDLKPANIKLASTGEVKVLDFGLAKALDSSASFGPTGDETTQPPPGSSVATIPGLVLGSPGYLSPEQARGQPADRRTDVFSFGCIIYEMLTGNSLFAGQSLGDSIGATLYKDPDWQSLPAATPPTIRLLLRRCLQKDPRKRLHDIADARLDLEEAIADPTGSMLNLAAGAYAPPRPWQRRVALLTAGLTLVLAGAAAGWLGSQWRSGAQAAAPSAKSVVQFSIVASEGVLASMDDSDLNHMALSDDGSLLAFTTIVQGEDRLMLREIATGQTREITAARDATGPFFSPDGRWLGFVDDNRIMKVSVQGGPASPVVSGVAPIGRVAWLENGRIVFTGVSGQGLYWVSANGGTPALLTASQRGQAGVESSQRPVLGFAGVQPARDGRSVLAPVWTGDSLDDYELTVVNSETGQLTRLLPHATCAAVVEGNVLVFLRNSTLLAVEFDPGRMTVDAEPVPVIQGIIAESWAADGEFAVSASGTIAYAPGGRISEGRRLVRVDPEGSVVPIQGPDTFVGQLATSPDGRFVTVSTLRRKLELWVYDLQRGTMTLVNSDGESYEPVWSPDGTELAFMVEGRDPAIVRKQVFSSAPRQIVLRGSGHYPSFWAADGTLLLHHYNPEGANQTDVDAVNMNDDASDQKPRPVIASAANEGAAQVSPDGKWMLYVSDVSGQGEVYLATYPFDGRTWQVSVGGGGMPMWGSAGKVYFLSDEEDLFAVPLQLSEGTEPQISQPSLLFNLKSKISTSSWDFITALPDGDFVALAGADWESEELRLEVIVNWGELVRQKLAQKGPP